MKIEILGKPIDLGVRLPGNKIQCKLCGKVFKSLGFARHRSACFDRWLDKKIIILMDK